MQPIARAGVSSVHSMVSSITGRSFLPLLDGSVFLQFYIYYRVFSAGLELLDTHNDATVSTLRLGLTPCSIAPALVPPISATALRNVCVRALALDSRERLLVASV